MSNLPSSSSNLALADRGDRLEPSFSFPRSDEAMSHQRKLIAPPEIGVHR
jgi:hypothetical protein